MTSHNQNSKPACKTQKPCIPNHARYGGAWDVVTQGDVDPAGVESEAFAFGFRLKLFWDKRCGDFLRKHMDLSEISCFDRSRG